MGVRKKEAIKKEQKKTMTANLVWIVLTFVFTLLYILWRVVRTVPYQKGVISDICWIILFIVEAIGLIEMMVHCYNMYNYGMQEIRTPARITDYPSVDVFVPSMNEPAELIEETLRACLDMEYRSRERIHIYLCDDGARDEVRELCSRLSVNYLARTEHSDAKAGNLNYALKNSSSELIAVFDADMRPEKNFLEKTVPYFCTGENVGFVQTPQSFYEPDLFQWNLYAEDKIPNEQDYFYRIVELAKNKSNSVIFGGSNALLSRKALEECGGFVTGVLTEDFATGIELEKLGYRGIAIDDTWASGRTADDMPSLIRQRRRWARGCIQSGRREHILLSSNLSFAQKINYFISVSYWYSPIKVLLYYLAPILFALFGIVVVECTLPEVMIFWLPMYFSSTQCIRRFSHGIRSSKWTRIYDMVLCPYLFFPVILESFGISAKTFEITEKKRGGSKSGQWVFMLPYAVMGVINLLAVVNLLIRSAVENTVSYSVVLLWLLLNLYSVFICILAVWRRDGWYSGEKELTKELNNDGKIGITALFSHLTDG